MEMDGDGTFHDSVSLVTLIRKSQQEKVELEEKLRATGNEIDILCALLECESKEDAESIVEEYIPEVSRTTTLTLPPNLKSFGLLQAYNITGVDAVPTDDDRILIKFHTIEEFESPIDCIISLSNDGNRYSYENGFLPPCVPINSLIEAHLNHETYNFQAFISNIQMYLRPYWARDAQIRNAKMRKLLPKDCWYFNTSRTVICFKIVVQEKYQVEFSLQYDSLSILPDKIKFDVADGSTMSKNDSDDVVRFSEALSVQPLHLVIEQSMGSSANESTTTVEESHRSNFFQLFAA